jgi:hypothetical protein
VGSVLSPTAANSLTVAGKLVLVALIFSKSGSVAMQTTNSPVSRTLRSESFTPTLVTG